MIDERDVWRYTWGGVAWARLFATCRIFRRALGAAIAGR